MLLLEEPGTHAVELTMGIFKMTGFSFRLQFHISLAAPVSSFLDLHLHFFKPKCVKQSQSFKSYDG